MIVTEIYNGQGWGNQLWCYVTTRVIATDLGCSFGIQCPEKFKGINFMNLDFGEEVIGGSGPEGGPPISLPRGIKQYYAEKKIIHPNGSDIRLYDKYLVSVTDGTKIDGVMQDEQYIFHRKEEIREWLKVRDEYDCFDYSNEKICIINFRGGEYVGVPELFLTKKYWDDAIHNMQSVRDDMIFVVVTDDVKTAKKFFPNFDVFHFSIEKDYVIIKNAHYLILSNSSFAWFPAWLNTNLKFCIAPKYWARHNISDGYWSCGYNITSGWTYQDKNGTLQDYDSCVQEFDEYQLKHKKLFMGDTHLEDHSISKNKISKKNYDKRKRLFIITYNMKFTKIRRGILRRFRIAKNYLISRIKKITDFSISGNKNLPQQKKKISEILKKYDTDKVRGDKLEGHSYGEAYDEVFEQFSDPINLLEIGVQKGGSLLAWKEYFPKSNIYGVDILDVRTYFSNDVNFIVSDIKKYRPNIMFDIIIDDGSHYYEDVLFVINNFLKKLNPKGVLVVEDTQNPEEWVPNIRKILPSGFTLTTKDLRHVNGYGDDFLIIIQRV